MRGVFVLMLGLLGWPALAVAHEAELGPGDAIFIPMDWYHHVEALEPLNMLVN